MYAFRMLQLGNWVLSTICGSMGVFTLWFSLLFHDKGLAQPAAAFLAAALALELARHYFLTPHSR